MFKGRHCVVEILSLKKDFLMSFCLNNQFCLFERYIVVFFWFGSFFFSFFIKIVCDNIYIICICDPTMYINTEHWPTALIIKRAQLIHLIGFSAVQYVKCWIVITAFISFYYAIYRILFVHQNIMIRTVKMFT